LSQFWVIWTQHFEFLVFWYCFPVLSSCLHFPNHSAVYFSPLSFIACYRVIHNVSMLCSPFCPRQHYIPIYLIVLGLSSLLFVLLSCFPCAKEPEEGTSNPLSTIYKAWNLLAMFFVFCWFIAGELKSQGSDLFLPNYDKNTTNVDPYCNKTLYLFAFWINTLVNISVGFIFLGVFLFLLGFCLYRGANPPADV
uniref:Uncharacterized protein n=1 Tax=Pundamilia nyererei TaxID=303518 RepID=A0A3B4FIJ0_9CICH